MCNIYQLPSVPRIGQLDRALLIGTFVGQIEDSISSVNSAKNSLAQPVQVSSGKIGDFNAGGVGVGGPHAIDPGFERRTRRPVFESLTQMSKKSIDTEIREATNASDFSITCLGISHCSMNVSEYIAAT